MCNLYMGEENSYFFECVGSFDIEGGKFLRDCVSGCEVFDEELFVYVIGCLKEGGDCERIFVMGWESCFEVFCFVVFLSFSFFKVFCLYMVVVIVVVVVIYVFIML